jgi:LysR family glycine cleavage system transcriptional activator
MPRRLPSLTALRAFEAAARAENLVKAAEELLVTHGAISRQVQALERWAGVALFERRGRRVVLTEAGRRFAATVGDSFDAIEQAGDRLRLAAADATVVVDALPTFVMRWLIPRLPRFHRQHPTVELRLVTPNVPLPRNSQNFDVGIRRGPPAWPGCLAAPFLEERYVPMAIPSLLKRLPLKRPSDLARHVLLESETRPNEWQRWLDLAGVPGLQPVRRQQFDHYYLALQAASDGLGVALGALPLLAEDVAAGRLSAPLDEPAIAAPAYHWVAPKRRADDPAVLAFCGWLEAEGRA